MSILVPSKLYGPYILLCHMCSPNEEIIQSLVPNISIRAILCALISAYNCRSLISSPRRDHRKGATVQARQHIQLEPHLFKILSQISYEPIMIC